MPPLTLDAPDVIACAARGELPSWAVVTPSRKAHIARVAELLACWSEALALPEAERDRWIAAAWLHDALRDEDPARLRCQVPAEMRGFPGPLLHGPAAAERLDGGDEEIRQAVRYHTLGHASFGLLGKALYLADFLEPGRDFDREWRAELAERVPAEIDAVLVEVLGARLTHLVGGRRPIRPETAAFWSQLVGRVGG